MIELAQPPPQPLMRPLTLRGREVTERYATAAINREAAAVDGAPAGTRNHRLNLTAFRLGQAGTLGVRDPLGGGHRCDNRRMAEERFLRHRDAGVARAAELYAARGWPVLPLWWPQTGGACACGNPECGNPGKHPLIRRGFHATSTDVATIRRWWTRWPAANVGIRTGGASGILDVDVDGELGMESLRKLRRERGQLCAAWARTGSGGWHAYLGLPTWSACAVLGGPARARPRRAGRRELHRGPAQPSRRRRRLPVEADASGTRGDARARYLRERGWPPHAAVSEDAFDAAVSPLVMDRHAAALAALPALADPVVRREGRIWTPPGSNTGM